MPDLHPLPQEAALPWFAVTVRPQHENSAYNGLLAKGIEALLPTYKSFREWSDRKVVLDRPLFPGYVLARFDWTGRTPVLSIPSIKSIVSFGSQPAPIHDDEITVIRRSVASGVRIQPWPFLYVGQTVRVERGPLRGVTGILLDSNDDWRLIVSISILKRSVAVTLDRDCLSPAE